MKKAQAAGASMQGKSRGSKLLEGIGHKAEVDGTILVKDAHEVQDVMGEGNDITTSKRRPLEAESGAAGDSKGSIVGVDRSREGLTAIEMITHGAMNWNNGKWDG